jgi:5'-deoxynucleotidase YfbR-like HD superfamily hydrolase
MTWLQTINGKAWDLLDPDPSAFDLEIACRMLARTYRYTGHTPYPYTVAQHSVYVGTIAGALHPPARVYGLIHDLHEAYIGDLPSPIKRLVSGYDKIEAAAERAVLLALGLPEPTPEIAQAVQAADLEMLRRERRVFFPQPARDWGAWDHDDSLSGVLPNIRPARTEGWRDVADSLRWSIEASLEWDTVV